MSIQSDAFGADSDICPQYSCDVPQNKSCDSRVSCKCSCGGAIIKYGDSFTWRILNNMWQKGEKTDCGGKDPHPKQGWLVNTDGPGKKWHPPKWTINPAPIGAAPTGATFKILPVTTNRKVGDPVLTGDQFWLQSNKTGQYLTTTYLDTDFNNCHGNHHVHHMYLGTKDNSVNFNFLEVLSGGTKFGKAGVPVTMGTTYALFNGKTVFCTMADYVHNDYALNSIFTYTSEMGYGYSAQVPSQFQLYDTKGNLTKAPVHWECKTDTNCPKNQTCNKNGFCVAKPGSMSKVGIIVGVVLAVIIIGVIVGVVIYKKRHPKHLAPSPIQQIMSA